MQTQQGVVSISLLQLVGFTCIDIDINIIDIYCRANSSGRYSITSHHTHMWRVDSTDTQQSRVFSPHCYEQPPSFVLTKLGSYLSDIHECFSSYRVLSFTQQCIFIIIIIINSTLIAIIHITTYITRRSISL
jgi:hypothetical protein